MTIPGHGYRFAEDVQLVPEFEVRIVASQHSKVAEHQKLIDNRTVMNGDAVSVLAHLGLARSYVFPEDSKNAPQTVRRISYSLEGCRPPTFRCSGKRRQNRLR